MKKSNNITAGEAGLQILPDMNHIGSKFFNWSTYGVTIAGITCDLELLQRSLLSVGGLILLGLQIYLHIIKIKNEKKNNGQDHTRKN